MMDPKENLDILMIGHLAKDRLDGQFHQALFTPRSLAGRTGRGDICFASYLGKRLTLDPEEATRWAAAVWII